MALSDRIAVMDAGRIVQVGPPSDIYDRPANAFIAGFIGDANFFDATVSAAANGLFTLAAPEVERVVTAPAGAFGVGDRVRLMVRPEQLALSAERPDGNALRVRIEGVAFLGDASAVDVRTAAGRPLSVRTARRDLPPVGSETWVSWAAEAGIVLKP
jgi:ABC-type Fe3+/spermidine/putrescine transport system ATPase subunit